MEVIVDTSKGVYKERIVRCKECKHNWDGECTETNHLVNGMVAFDVLPDDFCSYGVRKGADDE